MTLDLLATTRVHIGVTDGNFITAPAGTAHPHWLAQFLAQLDTEVKP